MHKQFVRLATTVVVGAFALAPVAGAYTVPGKNAGTPGGPQTKAKGGNHQSRTVTGKVANRFAGYTAAELATKGQISVALFFPKAGKIVCNASAFVPPGTATTKIGRGSISAKHKGRKTLNLVFGNGGIAFLNSHNLEGVTIVVKCTFKPKHGKSKSSTSTVETMH